MVWLVSKWIIICPFPYIWGDAIEPMWGSCADVCVLSGPEVQTLWKHKPCFDSRHFSHDTVPLMSRPSLIGNRQERNDLKKQAKGLNSLKGINRWWPTGNHCSSHGDSGDTRCSMLPCQEDLYYTTKPPEPWIWCSTTALIVIQWILVTMTTIVSAFASTRKVAKLHLCQFTS